MIPNKETSNQKVISLSELLKTPEYQAMRAESPLAIVLGQNTAGQTCVYDLSQGSHILVGGTNCAGKTNFLDACICSIISRSSPDEVKLCLIDSIHGLQPSIYQRLPHLHDPLIPIARGWDCAKTLLHGVVSEMSTRFERFEQISAQYQRRIETIEQYHTLQADVQGNGDGELAQPLPYVVVMIDGWGRDEAHDMGLALLRLLPMAHTVGIHVLVATSRPEDIPDVIASRMPLRIAFACASQQSCLSLLGVDRRGRLLTGKGDMLVKLPGSTTLEYIQAPLVTHEERARLVNAWAKGS